MGKLLFFPTSVTPEEASFGFAVALSPAGGISVTAALYDGLFALKARAPDGSIEYRVCNHALEPIDTSAASLDELRRRFRSVAP